MFEKISGARHAQDPGGVEDLGRVICWLRGEPESIAVVRRMRELLALQGVSIVLPEDFSKAYCDKVVCCDCGEEEAVCRDDPWLSLFEALAPPGGFHAVRAGVDPGSLCSLAVYADDLLVWLEKGECPLVAERVKWLSSVIPASRLIVNVGGGPGWDSVAAELSKLGVSFRVIPEARTTSRPLYSRLRGEIRDEDLLAAMTISLIS